MFTLLPRHTLFGHRGASAHAPENTLAAFRLALEHGADAIELDAKLSADGFVVVIHDQTVDRTTNGHGKVNELTLNELKKLDAGSYFDVAFRGEPLPTLEDVLTAVGRHTYINVELTNYASPLDSLPEKVAELVRRHELVSRVMFSSFNPVALRRVHKALPETPIGLLAFPRRAGALARSWAGRMLVPQQALHPELGDVTERLVAYAHNTRRRIHVYTVNDPADIRRLFAMGVDGVFTDDPRLARSVISGQWSVDSGQLPKTGER